MNGEEKYSLLFSYPGVGANLEVQQGVSGTECRD